MSASAKGKRDCPGKQVRQKAGLNRAILDASFGEFARRLAYKAEWYGRTLVKIDRLYPSSKTCSGCDNCNTRRTPGKCAPLAPRGLAPWPCQRESLKTPAAVGNRGDGTLGEFRFTPEANLQTKLAKAPAACRALLA